MAAIRSLEDQIGDIIAKNYGSIVRSSGTTIDSKILKQEAERLKELIAKYIRLYYESYSPRKYVRYNPYNMAQRLRVKPMREEKGFIICFDEDFVWGESVVSPGTMYGFEPILIDTGWQVNPKVTFSNVYRFGYYEGYHFIEKAIQEFNKDNPYGIGVKIEINTGANAEFGGSFKVSRRIRDYYDSMGTVTI